MCVVTLHVCKLESVILYLNVESIASDDEESEESDYFSPKYIPKPKPTVKKTYATSGITISVTQGKL